MKYGFVIDNRKCIGCHACTTACKQEHDVPLGVFRTWVKQVEKGKFPYTRRVFSVMRCNHCTNAPCVEICPVEALYFRQDGIVDFDKNRCIGCRSCMQACPYDALYIDPESHTAAKCNYCAHRVDVGLEPACVNVCPEHAIISGDMDNPHSEIAMLLSQEQVTVRKPAKGTVPNLFYIDGDEWSLNPTATSRSNYAFSAQERGIGHYSEKLAFDGDNLVTAALAATGNGYAASEVSNGQPVGTKSIDALMGQEARRYYDAPDKGILWGSEVWQYVWTKAIAAGAFLVPFLGWLFGKGEMLTANDWWASAGLSLLFLILTTALLVKDLDQPMRFVYVLLRPQWRSWLVKGGYALTLYGGLLTLWVVTMWLGWEKSQTAVMIATAVFAVIAAVYTAFLFAQAKGRDFWQSPMLPLHMLVHSLMAGAAAFLVAGMLLEMTPEWQLFLKNMLYSAIGANLVILLLELGTTHGSSDAEATVKMILKGRYSRRFWLGTLLVGNLVPLILMYFAGNAIVLAVAGVLALAGILITERIWVEAPQRIPLS